LIQGNIAISNPHRRFLRDPIVLGFTTPLTRL